MSYDANEVAKLVIRGCMDEGKPITNLKLQKVLYFMWLDWYKERNESLFNNKIEAWHYGPVVPDVYYRYRIFVADPICKVDKCSISGPDKELILRLARKYNNRSTSSLVNESHEKGSPWDNVRKDEMFCTEISKDLMIDEAGRR